VNSEAKRGLTALAVFAAIFLLAPILTKYNVYDVRVEMARLAVAVLGAGLYWIGSRDAVS